jgi:hypothetical protein
VPHLPGRAMSSSSSSSSSSAQSFIDEGVEAGVLEKLLSRAAPTELSSGRTGVNSMIAANGSAVLRLMSEDGSSDIALERPGAGKTKNAFDTLWTAFMLDRDFAPHSRSHMLRALIRSNRSAEWSPPAAPAAIDAIIAYMCRLLLVRTSSALAIAVSASAESTLSASSATKEDLVRACDESALPAWIRASVENWAQLIMDKAPLVRVAHVSTRIARPTISIGGCIVYIKSWTSILIAPSHFANAVITNHKRVSKYSVDHDFPWVSTIVWPVSSIKRCTRTGRARIRMYSPVPSNVFSIEIGRSSKYVLTIVGAMCKSLAALHICNVAHGCLVPGFFFAQSHRVPPINMEDVSIVFPALFDSIDLSVSKSIADVVDVRMNPFQRDIFLLLRFCFTVMFKGVLPSDVSGPDQMIASMHAAAKAVSFGKDMATPTRVRLSMYMEHLVRAAFEFSKEKCISNMLSIHLECARFLEPDGGGILSSTVSDPMSDVFDASTERLLHVVPTLAPPSSAAPAGASLAPASSSAPLNPILKFADASAHIVQRMITKNERAMDARAISRPTLDVFLHRPDASLID